MEILFCQSQLDLGECHDQFVEFHQIRGLVDQGDFKQAVVPANIGQSQKFRNGGRIGYHAVEEFVLDHAAVIFDPHAVCPNFRQLGDRVEQVGGVSQQIFEMLRRFVGDLRKCSECCHVGEVFVVEAAHVAYQIFAVNDTVYGLFRILGDSQTAGEVVSGAKGNVTDGTLCLAFHTALNDFVQGAVTAGADENIITAGIARQLGTGGGIAAVLCRMYGHLKSGSGEFVDDHCQMCPRRGSAGMQIADKIDLFQL